MGFDDNQWVALNLPKTAKFKKNGVVMEIDEAIQSALDFTKKNEVNIKEFALAMLLRMLSSDYPFDTFQLGPMTYTGSQLKRLADEWEMRGNGQTPYSLTSVPLVSNHHHHRDRDGFDGLCGW